MVHVYGGTHWDWYKLPVPMRKWYIHRWNKRQEEQNKQPSPDKPLSDAERQKMIAQSQQMQNQPQKPVSPRDLLTPQRNSK